VLPSTLLQVYFDLGRDISAGQDGWQPESYWSAAGILVPSAYAYGTDTNLANGILANNDLALVWLNPMNGTEVGDIGGWFSYGVNGWGFAAPSTAMGLGAPTAPATSQVTALAYPYAFDGADRMQISHSAAYSMQLNGLKRNPRGVKNFVRCALSQCVYRQWCADSKPDSTHLMAALSHSSTSQA
jgi:hypothetical protein